MQRTKWQGEQEERYYKELHWLKFEQSPLEYLELIYYDVEYNEQYWRGLRCSVCGDSKGHNTNGIWDESTYHCANNWIEWFDKI